MERQHVKSTLMRSVGFDPEAGILEIEFQNGHIYRYFDVPEFTFRALMRAHSKGAFFQGNIETRYRFEQLR